MMKKFLKRYKFFLITLISGIIITFINHTIGFKIFESASDNLIQMLQVLPPIMILLGLVDIWVPKEILMKYMGDNSGITGIIISILIGSIAAGPMYAAFPFTLVLLRKNVKFSNIIIFMNAWCVTKISTLLFEISALGFEFTMARFIINLPGIIIMGLLINWLLSKKDLEKIYYNAKKID
ncbi:MAG: permease [Clostridium sp.]